MQIQRNRGNRTEKWNSPKRVLPYTPGRQTPLDELCTVVREFRRNRISGERVDDGFQSGVGVRDFAMGHRQFSLRKEIDF